RTCERDRIVVAVVMLFAVQCKSPVGVRQVRQIIVSGKAVVLVEIGIIKLIGIKTISAIVQSAYAEKKFIRYNGCTDANSITLLSVTSDAYLRKTACLVAWLRGVDIDHPSHGVSAVQGSLRSAQHFYTFDIKQLRYIGIQAELVHSVDIRGHRRIVRRRSDSPN